MAFQQTAAVAAVSLAASIASAHAGPCSSEIDRLQARIDAQLGARAATTPSQKESTDALLHRQPTPKSVGEAEQRLGEMSAATMQTIERAMARAREADAAGNKGACEEALADAQRAIAR
jgi:hypothetical protein